MITIEEPTKKQFGFSVKLKPFRMAFIWNYSRKEIMFKFLKKKITVEDIKALRMLVATEAGNIHCDKENHYVLKPNDTFWRIGECTCIK